MIYRKEDGAQSTFEQARHSVAQGDVRRGLFLLLETLRIDPLHSEALQAAAKTVKMLGDARGAGLFQALSDDPENPERIYEVGFFLVGMGRPDVGRPFLSACLERDPANDDVRYELGFAHYLNRSYTDAIDVLREAAAGLSPERAAAAECLTVECLLYGGRREEAENLLERLRAEPEDEATAESLDALGLMARRLRRLEDEEPGDLRTWHFVQHGGVLLAESRAEDGSGRFRSLSLNPAAVGAVFRLLEYFLKGMNITPAAVLHAGGESYTLALVAGSILERPVRALDERAGSNELLVIPDLDAIDGREQELSERDEVAHLFCFRLDPVKPCRILPEITGIMAQQFRFPWQERVEVAARPGKEPKAFSIPADTRDAETVAQEIADLARGLPEDSKMAKVLKFYRRHRDLLVVSNSAVFPVRRAFTTFSPI
jgi:tetratricopeptide (TPR) repeat protein